MVKPSFSKSSCGRGVGDQKNQRLRVLVCRVELLILKYKTNIAPCRLALLRKAHRKALSHKTGCPQKGVALACEDAQNQLSPTSLAARDHPTCCHVEDLRAERGIEVSYETLRRWSVKFGLAYASRLRQSRPRPDTRWHLDEPFVSINGRRMYLWRAVDREGEALDILVQSRRNRKAALKLMRTPLKKHGFVPDAFVTDKLPSYGAALKDFGL